MAAPKGQKILTLHLLGKPKILYGESALDSSLASKEQALLIYLVCQPKRRFSREHLATLLWGEVLDSRARYNLRRALWKLRSALEEAGISPDDCIATDGNWVHLASMAPYWVDVRDFEETLERHFQDSDPRAYSRSENIQRALDLYRGDFLDGFSVLRAAEFEEWVIVERERLFLLLLRALTSLIQEFIARGERDKSIATCHRLLALDPLQEDIRRLLMRLYWETGQRPQAIHQYQTYQVLLQRELGIDPLEETQDLYQRILQREIPPTPATSSLVLTSRMTPPSPPPEALVRPRLLSLLDQGLNVRLTLISAPPGYGKTTLMAQWIDMHTQSDGDGGQQDLLFTWYRVSEVDNTSLTFMRNLAMAFAKINPVIDQALRYEIGDLLALGGGTRQAAGLLINTLTSLKPRPFVIILDDLDRLVSSDSLKALEHIVRFLPTNGHLYLLTRVDPALKLSRLRVQGQLLEIRARQLKFSDEEAAAFLQRTSAPNLDPAQADDLIARVQGWVAPLWLIANAFQRFTASLDMVWEGLSAYLRDEVLALQSPEVRTFLLQSAILDYLSPDLCQAVLDVPMTIDDDTALGLDYPDQAVRWLRELERRNLFLQRLPSPAATSLVDDVVEREEMRYSYHPLFLSFLRAELPYHLSQVEIEELHQRAAKALEEKGDLRAAITHYQRIGDEAEIARLLEKAVSCRLEHRYPESMGQWLGQLESITQGQHPQIALRIGQLHRAEGHLERARQLYQQAAVGFADRSDQLSQGDSLLALADLHLLGGRYAKGLELGRRAMACWDEKETQRRVAALCTIGQLQASQGDLSDAESTLKQARQLVTGLARPMLTFRVLRIQSWIVYLQGAYHRAMALNRLAEQEAGRDVSQDIVLAFHNPVPAILREWGEEEVAWQASQRRLSAARRSKDQLALIQAYIDMGNLRLDQGKLDAAENAFHRAIATAEGIGEDGLYRLSGIAHLVGVRLMQGERREVTRTTKIELDRCKSRGASPLELALARLCAALSWAHGYLTSPSLRMDEVRLKMLEEAFGTFDRLGVHYGAFLSAGLLSLVHLADDQSASGQQARHYALTALTLASAEGYVQTLVIASQIAMPLLLFALREGIEPRFVSHVLARVGPKALENVVTMAQDPHPRIRERVAVALNVIGPQQKDPESLATVLAALEPLVRDTDPDVQAMAVQAQRKIDR